MSSDMGPEAKVSSPPEKERASRHASLDHLKKQRIAEKAAYFAERKRASTCADFRTRTESGAIQNSCVAEAQSSDSEDECISPCTSSSDDEISDDCDSYSPTAKQKVKNRRSRSEPWLLEADLKGSRGFYNMVRNMGEKPKVFHKVPPKPQLLSYRRLDDSVVRPQRPHSKSLPGTHDALLQRSPNHKAPPPAVPPKPTRKKTPPKVPEKPRALSRSFNGSSKIATAVQNGRSASVSPKVTRSAAQNGGSICRELRTDKTRLTAEPVLLRSPQKAQRNGNNSMEPGTFTRDGLWERKVTSVVVNKDGTLSNGNILGAQPYAGRDRTSSTTGDPADTWPKASACNSKSSKGRVTELARMFDNAGQTNTLPRSEHSGTENSLVCPMTKERKRSSSDSGYPRLSEADSTRSTSVASTSSFLSSGEDSEEEDSGDGDSTPEEEEELKEEETSETSQSEQEVIERENEKENEVEEKEKVIAETQEEQEVSAKPAEEEKITEYIQRRQPSQKKWRTRRTTIRRRVTKRLVAPQQEEEPPRSPIHKVAYEMLTSERSYVAKLHLLDQVFCKQLEEANIPANVVSGIFSHVKPIYQFHHDFLLPQLEDRMKEWAEDRNKKMGDLMKNFAPFLKLYSPYIKNFDVSMGLVNSWMGKPKFAAVVEDIQMTEECGNLTLQHHMLEPVQRVPRYELLLRDYLKKLPQDSEDRPDTEKALELISDSARHSNEAMKKIEKFHKLLELHEQLNGEVDVVSPTREFLLEGKITKIAARSGEHQDRYLFLFNDMLLCCSPSLVGNRFRVRTRMDVDGMTVSKGNNPEEDTFVVQARQRALELYASTQEERDAWHKAIQDVIDGYQLIKGQIKREEDQKLPEEVSASELGKRAPQWIKDNEVTMCMRCSQAFNALKRRRHHCRACGWVVCSRCSNYKEKLEYSGKTDRVCKHCFFILKRVRPPSVEEESEKSKGVLELHAAEAGGEMSGYLHMLDRDRLHAAEAGGEMSGYLHMLDRDRRRWNRHWFALSADGMVLYVYKAHQDVKAEFTIPLPGYSIFEPDPLETTDREHVFTLSQAKQVYMLAADDAEKKNRWIEVLDRCTKV
ncbi:FYVE, RhoGEF and PH domain-containing protein 4-like [Branchiostoma floridae]|uniref:FYVE, RhoGEF and PH domain-containing protein 4-like n=1 Tax=Branchiostoma floridae TaxID=7739 RepID=A0A9J7L6P0_BRAFL|nr:FYVE, RhoGEF and PH domain-containing protein 4-like [Branchiostoma floridae]